MSLYMDVLEEWDDKISDDKNIEDVCLHPVDWVDQTQNDNSKTDIKCLVEDCFDDVIDYLYDTY